MRLGIYPASTALIHPALPSHSMEGSNSAGAVGPLSTLGASQCRDAGAKEDTGRDVDHMWNCQVAWCGWGMDVHTLAHRLRLIRT